MKKITSSLLNASDDASVSSSDTNCILIGHRKILMMMEKLLLSFMARIMSLCRSAYFTSKNWASALFWFLVLHTEATPKFLASCLGGGSLLPPSAGLISTGNEVQKSTGSTQYPPALRSLQLGRACKVQFAVRQMPLA